MLKPLTVWIITKLWKTLKEMGISDHLTFLLRNLYVGQEATGGILYGTTDWFRIEKGIPQGCLLSLCLFNLHAEHIMRNAGLDKLQAGIKIGGRNINNLRYADDTMLMAESEEELNSPLMRVKEESERSGLKLNIKKKTTTTKLRSWHLVPLSSVQFSRSVVSYSLLSHESQHARPPCPSPAPGVYSNSSPSSQ